MFNSKKLQVNRLEDLRNPRTPINNKLWKHNFEKYTKLYFVLARTAPNAFSNLQSFVRHLREANQIQADEWSIEQRCVRFAHDYLLAYFEQIQYGDDLLLTDGGRTATEWLSWVNKRLAVYDIQPFATE